MLLPLLLLTTLTHDTRQWVRLLEKKKEKANQCCWLITWGQRTHSSQNWWSPTAAAKLHLKISRSKNAKEKTVIRQFTAAIFPLFLLNGPTAAAAAAAALTTLTQIRISDRSAGRQSGRQARIGKGTERKKEATIDLGDQRSCCCCSTDLWSKQQQLNLFVHWAAAAMANCHWQFACCRCCRQIKQTKKALWRDLCVAAASASLVWRERSLFSFWLWLVSLVGEFTSRSLKLHRRWHCRSKSSA